MTSITSPEAAARFEHLDQGLVPTSDVICYPLNGPGPPEQPDPRSWSLRSTGRPSGSQCGEPQGVALVASRVDLLEA
jgi:hypothetical protein